MIYICKTKQRKVMITIVFTDIKTKETFTVECNSFELHSIEQINKELGKWCEGRILKREII